MNKSLAVLFLLLFAASVEAAEPQYRFEGTWRTTNRRLDGDMKCDFNSIGKERWQARFYGVWQGVDFDYTVRFAGPPDDLQGEATIDNAYYKWRGRADQGSFSGNFTGDRYTGSFNLKRSR